MFCICNKFKGIAAKYLVSSANNFTLKDRKTTYNNPNEFIQYDSYWFYSYDHLFTYSFYINVKIRREKTATTT